MQTMNTETAIQNDLADIEGIAEKIAEEIGAATTDKAVRAGVEIYAKARMEDLRSLLDSYTEAGCYVAIQDMLKARIWAISRAYDIR
jgi:low affinity Fe/Cu permease